jgi:TonB family protein
MNKGLTFVLCLCFLVLGLSRSSLAQDTAARTLASVSSESGNRDQDGLNGPVRRVRAETARIMVKEGKMVEGPRVLRSITTYDPKGLKIDSVAYPLEGSTLPGREQYQYDTKGNIVQMILRGDDGAILTKENYEYEFDELGNWKKMTSSVAVYENGKVSYEPTEVTYRTITYYYGQAVDKLAASPKAHAGDTTVGAPGTSAAARVATPTSPRKSAPAANKIVREEVSSPPPVTEKKVVTNEPPTTVPDKKVTIDESLNTVSEKKTAPELPAAATPDTGVSVNYVTEEVLRGAAINLPNPEYPSAARLAHAAGKVEVHIIVDEKGEVVTARSMSGHPMLTDAAEIAARKATFSRAKLSSEPGSVYGVINYDFAVPAAEVSAIPTSTNTVRTPPPQNAKNSVGEGASSPVSTSLQGASPVAEVVNATNSPEPATARYERALTYLSPNANADGVAALKEAIQRNPNDGMAYRKLGIAYSGMGQHKEAIAVFKMAIRISPELIDAEGYHYLGHAYLALGKHSEALAAFKQAMYLMREQALDPEGKKTTKSPSPLELHYSLSLAYHQLGRYQDAIKELTQVIALNPKLAEAYYGLAVAYLGMGDRRSAEKQQTTLASLNPALADRIATALARTALTPGCRTIACR